MCPFSDFVIFIFFFFQAEDGIRDLTVTGVQTCALPICLWLGGTPTPVRVSAALDTSGRDRAVEQSGSALVVCENGMSIFVDVTWRHLGEGERFGVGLRGSKGTAGINPLTVWKELHGVAVDVSPTGSVSRENAFTASYRAEWAHFQA